MPRIHRTLHKKVLNEPDNHSNVLIHLELDTLEYEVKWALCSIATDKASGGDGIPVELIHTLKTDAVKVLNSTCLQIWKTQPWSQGWKRSVFIPIPKKGNAKKMLKLQNIFSHFTCYQVQFSSVQFSRSVVSDSLRPHDLQYARPPCPTQSPGVYSNSCPSSR